VTFREGFHAHGSDRLSQIYLGSKPNDGICRKIAFQCAGLNRHEAEEEEASRERTSDPLGPEFCVRHREVHDEA